MKYFIKLLVRKRRRQRHNRGAIGENKEDWIRWQRRRLKVRGKYKIQELVG